MDIKFRKPFLWVAGLFFVILLGTQFVREPQIQVFVNSVGVMIVGFAYFVLEYISDTADFQLMVGWLLIVVLGFIGTGVSLGTFTDFSTITAVGVILILIIEGYIFYKSSGIYSDPSDSSSSIESSE